MTFWQGKRLGGIVMVMVWPGMLLALAPAPNVVAHHAKASNQAARGTAERHVTPRELLGHDLRITDRIPGALPLKTPYLVGNVWTAIDFVNPSDGWVAGNSRIMVTRNGGGRWRLQYHGRLALQGLRMENTRTGYAWSPHEILVTHNGGATWQAFRSPGANPTQLVPAAAHRVYLVASGHVYVSHDNGARWARVATPGSTSAIAMNGAGTGYAVSAGGPIIWKTMDGGRQWTRALRFHEQTGGGGDVAMTGGTVWAALGGGYGMNQESYTIFRSTDGGAHWQAVAAHPTAGGGSAPGTFRSKVPVAPGLVLLQMAVLSPASAILATGCGPCADGTASLSVTTDGGSHWTHRPNVAGFSGFSAAVSFLTPERGWMATGSGLVLATRNGGQTWTPLYPRTRPAPIYGWSWLNNRTAYGLGTVGNADVLLKTTDAGASWLRVATIPAGPNTGFLPFAETEPIDFVANNDGWLVSPSSGALVHDRNGRLSVVPPSRFRTKSNPSGAVANVYFLNRRDGGVTAADAAAVSFVTTNGGRTWERSPWGSGSTAVLATQRPNLARILNQLSNNSRVIGYDSIGIRTPQVWMQGFNGMFYSHNLGRTWVFVHTALANAMTATSPSGRLFVALAGQYFTSSNDGVSWTKLGRRF